GRAAGTAVEAPVGLLDVAPTLQTLTGAAADPRRRGVSLLARIAGDASVHPQYAETLYPRIHFGWSELTSVVDGPWHFIQGPDPELYDLAADAAERSNRRDERRPEVRRMQELLRARPLAFRAPAAPSAEEMRKLAALGYVGSAAPAPTGSGPLPDPKREIRTLEPLTRGFQAFAQKDYATAIPALRATVERHPRLVEAWEYLGQALVASGQRDAAIAAYRDGLAQVGSSVNLAAGAARALIEAGRPAEALRYLDLQLGRTPDAPMLLGLRVRALLLTDRTREAVDAARRLVAVVPASADAHYQLGIASLLDGDAAGAERELRRVLELSPRHVRAMNDLAVLLRDAGRVDEAAELLRRALAIDPAQETARRNLQSLTPR
ncbi:MAG TPA: tetratricopeptide repeat protein, partial [Thermoanaerobaculia bacterium]|nr:tetratricopeptide repeat protein [Thermoanaerobaculia bacterium]